MPPRKSTAATSLRAVGMSAICRHDAAVDVARAEAVTVAASGKPGLVATGAVAARVGLRPPAGVHAAIASAAANRDPRDARPYASGYARGPGGQRPRPTRRVPALALRVPGMPRVPRLHRLRLPRRRARSPAEARLSADDLEPTLARVADAGASGGRRPQSAAPVS